MRKNKKICIYRHIRLDNNTIFYIGIGYLKRAYSKANRNKHWLNIINKTDYEIQILKSDLSWEDACELEIALIDYYGRRDLKTGTLVNLTDGGEGSYGRIVSLKTKEKLSKGRLGKPGTFKGKKHTQESILKISESKMGICNYSKKIINKEKNIIYDSCKEAAYDLGIAIGTLTYHLNRSNSKFKVEYYKE